jgi:hypothetical protein
MNLLKTLINPKLAAGLIRSQIERQLKVKVPEFTINYSPKLDAIFFTLNGLQYEFDNDIMKSQIKEAVKDMLKKGEKLEFIKVEITAENEVSAKVYFIDIDLNKKCITKKF